MKPKQIIMLILIILLLSFTFTMVYYSYFVILKVEKSTYLFDVQNHVGIVGDRDAIKFGGIPPAGRGSRSVYFNNNYDYPVRINIKIKGEKSEWIVAEENNFLLEPNETKTLTFTVFVPGEAEMHDNYTGIIKAYYIKNSIFDFNTK